MKTDLYNNELHLANNAPVRLLSARGVRVTCTAGLLWLTTEGEAGDIFLAPGESHLVRGRGLTLLEAIGSGCAEFEQTDRPWRWLRQLANTWRTSHALARLGRRHVLPLPNCQRPVVGGA